MSKNELTLSKTLIEQSRSICCQECNDELDCHSNNKDVQKVRERVKEGKMKSLERW